MPPCLRDPVTNRVPSGAVKALLVLAVVLGACGSDDRGASRPSVAEATGGRVETGPIRVTPGTGRTFPPPPPSGSGPLDDELVATVELLIGSIPLGIDPGQVAPLADTDDARVLWIIADWLQFTQGSDLGMAFVDAAESVAGLDLDGTRPWGDLTDHLIAWDLPAPPGYRNLKGGIYTSVDARWAFVFDDPEAKIDYRLLGWGGVLIDDRELGDPDPCTVGCIPALDDPALVPAADGDWYPDDGVVFGVTVGADSVALPRNIMEVHEMVNMTIGGRRVAVPYCTLCGSAQLYFTDEVTGVDRPPVLRTSGLLSRSNKVMYDLDSLSVFDTFTGVALSGPLRAADVRLRQGGVVVTTWSQWRQDHPDTLIVAADGGIGRSYPPDPLRGRDDDGPIFPIGDVDPRLDVHESVLGVEVDGSYVAFPAAAAKATLDEGDPVEFGSIALELDGGGLRATVAGQAVPSHQAFWFAWSQFHPDTALWLPGRDPG